MWLIMLAIMGVGNYRSVPILIGEKPNFWLCPPAIWECVIGNLNYNYIEGDPKGPENWWKLHDNWAQCGKGQMQSPIDLSDEEKDPTLGNLKLNYMATNATLVNHGREVVVREVHK